MESGKQSAIYFPNKELVKEMYDMLTQFATGGIKILLMINGGAAVAVLAFLGNLLRSTNANVSMMIRPLARSMIAYTAGVVFATLTAFGAYYCQLQFIELGDGAGGAKTRSITIFMAISSIVFFAVGSIGAGYSIGCYFFE